MTLNSSYAFGNLDASQAGTAAKHIAGNVSKIFGQGHTAQILAVLKNIPVKLCYAVRDGDACNWGAAKRPITNPFSTDPRHAVRDDDFCDGEALKRLGANRRDAVLNDHLLNFLPAFVFIRLKEGIFDCINITIIGGDLPAAGAGQRSGGSIESIGHLGGYGGLWFR